MNSLFFLCAILLAGLPAGEQHPVLDRYIEAQDALARDSFEDAKTALESLAEASEGEMKELALQAASAGDLKVMRAAFKPLSAEVVKLDLPQGHIHVSCPMADGGKGASWVQKEGKIRNPYFGSSMLGCGTIQKKK